MTNSKRDSIPFHHCLNVTKEFHVLQSQLEASIKAVLCGSIVAKALQCKLREDEKYIKSDGSPLTVADLAVQAVMFEILSSHSEGLGVKAVAEEHVESEDVLDQIVETLNRECPLSSIASHSSSATATAEEVENWTPARILKLFTSTQLCNNQEIQDFTKSVKQKHDEEKTVMQHWSQSSYFVIDPIDGTKGFLRNEQFAVGLCLVNAVNGDLELSVIACPNLPDAINPSRLCDESESVVNSGVTSGSGQIFYAVKDQGTRCVSIQSLLSCSLEPPLVKVLRVREEAAEPLKSLVCLESYEAKHTDFSLSQQTLLELGVNLEQRHVIRLDSMAKYALVARGDGSILMRFPRQGYLEKVWDILPGLMITKEAGGVITHGDGTEINGRDKIELTNMSGIVATGSGGKSFHSVVIEAVRVAILKLKSETEQSA